MNIKKVIYELHPEISNTGGFLEKEGTIIEFIVEMGILGDEAILPTLDILNDMFREGKHPRSGCWDSFEITNEEYEQIKRELKKINGKEVRYIDIPDWVKTAKEFHYWVIEYVHGIPGKENMELTEKLLFLSNEIIKAKNKKNHELAKELAEQRDKAQLKREQFIKKYKLS